MAPIVHIVTFEFAPELDQSGKDTVCQDILSLRQTCIHPTTQKPYISSFTGGKDNSIEGLQGGLTHVFVAHFDSEEDRKYYIEKDPAHLAFVQSLAGKVVQVRVLDFSPGVF